jgi:bifunctional ADP-heptose synthase (sugar kinase/adenylyltransferase)
MKHEFPEFHLARVAVIGDLMLDRFYFGSQPDFPGSAGTGC